jgi:hypothetical protein
MAAANIDTIPKRKGASRMGQTSSSERRAQGSSGRLALSREVQPLRGSAGAPRLEARVGRVLLFNAAQAHRRAGHTQRALELYRNFVRLYPGKPQLIADARKRIAELERVRPDSGASPPAPARSAAAAETPAVPIAPRLATPRAHPRRPRPPGPEARTPSRRRRPRSTRRWRWPTPRRRLPRRR